MWALRQRKDIHHECEAETITFIHEENESNIKQREEKTEWIPEHECGIAAVSGQNWTN